MDFSPPQQVPLHCIVNANFLGFQWQQRQKFLLCRKVITMCAQLAVPYYCSPQTHQTEVNTRSTCAGPNLAFSLHLLTVFKPSWTLAIAERISVLFSQWFCHCLFNDLDIDEGFFVLGEDVHHFKWCLGWCASVLCLFRWLFLEDSFQFFYLFFAEVASHYKVLGKVAVNFGEMLLRVAFFRDTKVRATGQTHIRTHLWKKKQVVSHSSRTYFFPSY